MKRIIIAVLAGLVISPFVAGAASAASLTVAVRQVNPDSAPQTVTCQLKSSCNLPFVINAGQPSAQSLNINIAYVSGRMAVTFQIESKYFYTGDTGDTKNPYNVLWIKEVSGNAPASHQVTLFQPLSEGLIDRKPVWAIEHTSVANLEITATPVP